MYVHVLCLYLCHLAVVEDSYSGPKLDGEITAEFMQDLLQWYKDENRLHKKYAYKVSGGGGGRYPLLSATI